MKKKKNTKKKKGFTLIELLVVIAIIGLLATLAVVSMGSARAKARDAKRVSDIKQMSTILDVEDAAVPGSSVTGTANCNSGAHNNAAVCNLPGDVNQFNKFIDPSGNTTPCTTGANAGSNCQYSIGSAAGTGPAKTNDYEICFRTENGVGGLGNGNAGIKSILSGGVVTDSCL